MINRTQPKVSIVIPSYNQGQFIEQTLESILQQTYQNVQIIVCDGGSTDNTVEVLKKYGDKIEWMSEKDNGQTDAINKGINRATGQVLAYLNSDDYYLPGAIEAVVTAFAENENALWLTGDYVIVDEKGHARDALIVNYKLWQRKIMKAFPLLQRVILGINNPIIQPSTFWRRELFESIGPFREDLRYTMDYDYWLSALKMQSPLILEKKLSAFRIHGASKGGSQYEKQMSEQLQVAKTQGVSSFVRFLQSFHNALIIWWYRRTK